MTNATLRGKPDAGNPHVRFDEGEVASAKPRRESLLYKARQVKRGVFAAAILGWTAAYAAVSVSNVVVQQRWPWNGKVDIDYEVFSDNADDSVFVYPDVKENDRNIAIAPRTLTGDGVETAMVGARVKPGKHRMTWHMDTDEPKLHSSSSTITLHAVKGGMYLVVDLSGGPNAESYPIRYSDVPPDLTKGDCRTTELWLRLCLPGTFTMGSPSDEPYRGYAYTSSGSGYGNEKQHRVTLTKPFYMGVFEMTQAQYNYVMGSNPSSYKGDTRPVETVSWNTIRGSVAGAAFPAHTQVDPTSFMGKLRARTGCLFDLPTEAQWEYACRAGTSTALNSGKGYSNANINEVARNQGNLNDGKGGYTQHTQVGSYKPNQWGLYDMHGNVAEWCLDWWRNELGSAAVTDPVGLASGQYRVCRGGIWYYDYDYRPLCRSASRSCYVYNDTYPSYSYYYWGFRVACIPVVQ